MKIATDGLFLSHPDPMWIYDLETLRFLAVNKAAISKYGYSEAEFLAMTIADIRPEEDRAALHANVAAVTTGRDEAGTWRHRLKSGEVIHVDITGHTLDHGDRRAELIAARDVSRLVIAERTAQEALEREHAARVASDTLARDVQIMFDSVPGMFLVFAPESFHVIAASEDYLAAMHTTRRDVVGQTLFAVLPEQPHDGSYTGLRASCDRVLTSGETDLLAVHQVLVPMAAAAQGYQERYWTASNSPVAGPDGRTLYLMLRLQDVTRAIKPDSVDAIDDGGLSLDLGGLDLVAHTREQKEEVLRLLQLAQRLHTTQRLLNSGTWHYVLAEDRMVWSSNVYDMYGVTEQTYGHGFEDYVALVHPDDRPAMRENFRAFMGSDDRLFSFAHRIVHGGGEVMHMQGVAEERRPPMGPC